MGIVTDLAQQRRIVGIGRGDRTQPVFAAVGLLVTGRREPAAAEQILHSLAPQLRHTAQLRLRSGENPLRRTEFIQQVHHPLHAQPGSHRQSQILDHHDNSRFSLHKGTKKSGACNIFSHFSAPRPQKFRCPPAPAARKRQKSSVLRNASLLFLAATDPSARSCANIYRRPNDGSGLFFLKKGSFSANDLQILD